MIMDDRVMELLPIDITYMYDYLSSYFGHEPRISKLIVCEGYVKSIPKAADIYAL